MILFCEECGTRHDIDENLIKGGDYKFSCSACHETLCVSLNNRQYAKNAQAALHDDGDARSGDAVATDRVRKVLVVDDSRMIRKVLRGIIESSGKNKVIGEAENGKIALEMITADRPDVITLDINMPVMDGLTTLKHIMISHPIPTVMISALTKEGATETFDSLKYGAIDFLPKPSQVKGADLNTQRQEILRKIELVAGVQVESIRYLRRSAKDNAKGPDAPLPCQCVVVLGVAEGGYGALLNVIPRLKAEMPAAYVAIMHQAPYHVDGFVRYLDQCSRLRVGRAADGLVMQGGHCYLSADCERFQVAKTDGQIRLQLDPSTGTSGCGAIDQMMNAAATAMHEDAAGVILTGTGEDGIDGLGAIMDNGGTVFVQDPRSCLFKETPVKAIDTYHITNLISDKQMAGAINAFLMAQTKSIKEMYA